MAFGNPAEGTRTLSVSSDGCFHKVRWSKTAAFAMCGGLFAGYLLNATENRFSTIYHLFGTAIGIEFGA
jgi:hypothetical protein